MVLTVLTAVVVIVAAAVAAVTAVVVCRTKYYNSYNRRSRSIMEVNTNMIFTFWSVIFLFL